MRVFCLLLLVLGLTTAAASAQTDCAINLDEAADLLTQAQEAADAGDTTAATTLISDANNALSEILAGCATSSDTQTYILEDERSGHKLTFDFPADWVFEAQEDNQVSIASTPDLLERDVFGQNDPGVINENEFAIQVGLLPAGDIGLGVDDGTPTALALLESLLESDDNEMEIIRDAETVEVGAYRAASLTIAFEGSEFVIMVMELDNQDQPADDFYYGLLAVGSAAGSEDVLRKMAEDFAASLVYDRAD